MTTHIEMTEAEKAAFVAAGRRMGHTRAHSFPPVSNLRMETHNGVSIVANPKGVPAVWMPIYRELASRLYGPDPIEFSIGKGKGAKVVTCELRIGGEWLTLKTPDAARAALGLDAPAKPAKPAKPRPVTVMEAFTPKPAPVVEVVEVVETSAPALVATLPAWAETWLETLVYETKREYAAKYLEHVLCGADAPTNPKTDWAEKARKRADWLAANRAS